jgi:hypothetical protein
MSFINRCARRGVFMPTHALTFLRNVVADQRGLQLTTSRCRSPAEHP